MYAEHSDVLTVREGDHRSAELIICEEVECEKSAERLEIPESSSTWPVSQISHIPPLVCLNRTETVV